MATTTVCRWIESRSFWCRQWLDALFPFKFIVDLVESDDSDSLSRWIESRSFWCRQWLDALFLFKFMVDLVEFADSALSQPMDQVVVLLVSAMAPHTLFLLMHSGFGRMRRLLRFRSTGRVLVLLELEPDECGPFGLDADHKSTDISNRWSRNIDFRNFQIRVICNHRVTTRKEANVSRCELRTFVTSR